jgi:hypothetical protein
LEVRKEAIMGFVLVIEGKERVRDEVSRSVWRAEQ